MAGWNARSGEPRRVSQPPESGSVFFRRLEQAVLPRNDDPASLATLAGGDRVTQCALAPRLRARNVLFDNLGRERHAEPFRLALTITALFVDRDCPFLRATLAQVRDQWARTGRACPFNGAFSVPRFRCPYGKELVNDGPVTIVLD